MNSLTVQIMEALSTGPKVASVLLTPPHVHEFNLWHQKNGSHWRVRGDYLKDPHTGKRVSGIRYHLVMEK